MEYNKYIKTLKSCELFEGLDDAELVSALACLDPQFKSCKKNGFIAVAEQPFGYLGILLSGQITVCKESSTGTRSIVAVLDSPSLFGEVAVFAGMRNAPATIIAKEDSEYMLVHPDKLISTCDQSCGFHRQIISNALKAIAKRALILNKKLEYLTYKSLRERIAAYLLDQLDARKSQTFQLDVNRAELADYMCVSRPSLSREMSSMREEGLFDFVGSSVKILDIPALRALIE